MLLKLGMAKLIYGSRLAQYTQLMTFAQESHQEKGKPGSKSKILACEVVQQPRPREQAYQNANESIRDRAGDIVVKLGGQAKGSSQG
jgi:hypothetical protein